MQRKLGYIFGEKPAAPIAFSGMGEGSCDVEDALSQLGHTVLRVRMFIDHSYGSVL